MLHSSVRDSCAVDEKYTKLGEPLEVRQSGVRYLGELQIQAAKLFETRQPFQSLVREVYTLKAQVL